MGQFTVFGFFRYKGLIGNRRSNQKNIELQFMKRFCRESVVITKTHPTEHCDSFSPLLDKLCCNNDKGSLSEVLSLDYVPLLKIPSRNLDYQHIDWKVDDNSSLKIPGTKNIYALTDTEFRCIYNFYYTVYPQFSDADLFIPCSGWKSTIVTAFNEVFGAHGSRSSRSSHITAYWCGKDGVIQNFNQMYFVARPGRIKYFLSHILYVDDNPLEHLLAFVEW